MADQSNPWDTAPAADSAAQSADAWGTFYAGADRWRRCRLAEQRARAAAGTLQYYGPVP